MKKTLLTCLLLLSLISLSSCNSIESRNHYDDTFKGTYPGIQYNNSEWKHLEYLRQKNKISRVSRDFKRLGLLIDYPFSAILDTLAIPFDIEDKAKKHRKKKLNDKEEPSL